MLDVTVKTLDGKNRTFSVSDDITVKEFKEKIAPSIDITIENQRLIFIGRVLQDDKKLNDYDVNGKTLHVVERPPPGARAQNTASSSTSNSTIPGAEQIPHGAHNIVLGSIQLPGENVEIGNVQNIVQQALAGIGGNSRVSTRTSADGSSVDVHINLGHVQIPNAPSESQRRIDLTRKMINQAKEILNRIENPRSSSRSPDDSRTNQTSTPEGNTQSTPSQSMPNPESLGADDDLLDLSLEDQHGHDSEMRDVEAISIVTETVEAEIEMETDETNGTSSVSAIRIPQGAQSTVQTLEIGRGGSASVQADAGVQTETTTSAQSNNVNTTGTNTTNQQTRTQHPRPSVYADLLGEVFELNQRLQPHFERYQRILREDPNFDGQNQESRETQRFFNQISQIMHNLSHAYHSMSDLMVDMTRNPPRQLRAAVTHLPSVMQHAIPVQSSVSIQHVPANAGTRINTTATPTSSTRVTPSATIAATSQTSGTANSTSSTPRTSTTSTTSSSNMPPPFGIPGLGFPGLPGMPPIPGMPPMPGMPPGMPAAQSGVFAAGAGRPPFIPPDVFENIMRMATSAATSAVQEQFSGGMQGGAPRPHGQVFVVTQSSGANVQNTSPTVSGATRGPRPASQQPPIGTAANGIPNVRNNPRPSGAHVHAAGAGVPQAPTQGNHPRGVVIGIPRNMPQGILPQGLMGMNAIDPFLPCQSRHFLSRRAGNLASQGQRVNNGVNANAENGLAGVVSNIVNLIGQNTNQSTAQATQTASAPTASNTSQGPVVNPFAALFGGNTRATTAGGGSPPASFVDQLRNILQLGQTVESTSTSSSTTTTSSSSSSTAGTRPRSQPQPVTDEMFTDLVSGISQYVGQAANTGQTPAGTIADFLSSLGEGYSTPLGESLITDIFNTVSSNINLVDLMRLFSGDSTSLQNTRVPLQRYITDALMPGSDPTPENIEDCVDQVMTDAAPIIEQACSGLETRNDIDIEASYNTFLGNHLTDLATFIMNSTDTDTDFHSRLYSRVRRLIHEAIILGETCLQGGFSEVTRVVHSRVGSIATDVNPLIRQWMSDVTVQQLQNLRPNITVTAQDVQPYIIKRSDLNHMETSSHSSDENEPFMSADEEAPEGEKKVASEDKSLKLNGVSDHNKPEKEKKVSVKPTTSESSQLPSANNSNVAVPKGPNDNIIPRVAPEGGAHPPRQTEDCPLQDENGELQSIDYSNSAARLRPQMTPMAYHTVRCAAKPTDDELKPNVKLGSEDWHNVVPEEWVPVITKDIERQKKQEKQKPHSDAYMNGNPAKKRKVTRYAQGETEQLAYPESSITEAVQIAANAVGARPISSVDTLTSDIGANAPLQASFHHEVRNEVRKNLRDETDLVPYKYKSTEKYFGNKK